MNDTYLRQMIYCLQDIKKLLASDEQSICCFSYPFDGSAQTASIDAGVTEIDFYAGTVKTPAGTISNLRHSLRSEGHPFIRSLYLYADRPLYIQLDSGDKQPVPAGRNHSVTSTLFTELKIHASESTEIYVLACTSPSTRIDLAGLMKITDERDEWGQESKIGLSEQAVRMGQIIPIDRRGTWVFKESFEDYAARYSTLGNGSQKRSTSNPRTGNYCLEITTPALASESRVIMFFIKQIKGRAGISICFRNIAQIQYMKLGLTNHDGTEYYDMHMRYNRGSTKDTFEIWDENEEWHEIYDYGTHLYDTIWHNMKMVGDMSTGEYLRCIIDSDEIDLSEYKIYHKADADRYTIGYISVSPVDDVARTCFIDDIIITILEPENT